MHHVGDALEYHRCTTSGFALHLIENVVFMQWRPTMGVHAFTLSTPTRKCCPYIKCIETNVFTCSQSNINALWRCKCLRHKATILQLSCNTLSTDFPPVHWANSNYITVSDTRHAFLWMYSHFIVMMPNYLDSIHELCFIPAITYAQISGFGHSVAKCFLLL